MRTSRTIKVRQIDNDRLGLTQSEGLHTARKGRPADPQRIMSASECRIDVLGMPNNPPYGTSMSRITNIALVTDKAHNAMTMVLRVFG